MSNYIKKENVIIAVIVVIILVVGTFAFFNGKKSRKTAKVKTQNYQTQTKNKKDTSTKKTSQVVNP